jgi:tRNA nucleotidyltransferase/poly(A) polymerase
VTGDGATFYGHEIIGARTAEKVMSRLRYSNDMINAVKLLVDKHMFTTSVTDKGLRRLIKKTEGRIFDLLELRKADIIAQGRGDAGVREIEEFEQKIREELAKKSPFSLRDLKVNGNVLMEKFKLSPGPIVGQVLHHLLEKVLDDPDFNQEDLLLEEAKNFLDSQNFKITREGA